MEERKIKCLVWDLDNTLWDGTLLEDANVTLREEVRNILRSLDERGILQSIASKNEYATAAKKLEELGVLEYFIYPRINWNPKSDSIEQIREDINVGMNTIAFIDDQEYELEEVGYAHPEVLCINTRDIRGLLDMPEMCPRFITDESKNRRQMYLHDLERKKTEEAFKGPNESFLRTLDMVLTIGPATTEDLKRAEELTVRTNQLNTTGYTYSFDELDGFRTSDRHRLLVARLDDKFGTYGKIGLVLLEVGEEIVTIKLLLTSCRVMTRGVGTVLINYLRKLAREMGARLQAEFIHTDVNRMMYMTYMFTHFKEIERSGDVVLLENDLSEIQSFPDYMTVGEER